VLTFHYRKAAQREIRVWFNADVADNMPWDFEPTQPCVSVKAGQSVLAFFTAHNKRYGMTAELQICSEYVGKK
jgi:cytochrome c oxidase assembly protein Cox11